MKKSVSIILTAALLACLSLIGCGHEHTTSDEWSVGIEEHWHECADCGKHLDSEKHNLNEESTCDVCGAAIYPYDDGSGSIYMYDENGSMIYNCELDSEGELIYSYRYEIEYYEDGSEKHKKEYCYDIVNEPAEEYLSMEWFSLPCENPDNGTIYTSKDVIYEMSGAKIVTTYNELSYPLVITYYEASGDVTFTERYEYEFDENDNWTRQTVYTDDVISLEVFSTTDEDGNTYESRRVYYDENGQVERDVKYDAEGNEIE